MVEKFDITLNGGLKSAVPKKKKRAREFGTWMYLGMVGQIGYTVAIPLVVGALLGKFLGSAIIGLGIGTVISIIGFVRIIQEVSHKKS